MKANWEWAPVRTGAGWTIVIPTRGLRGRRTWTEVLMAPGDSWAEIEEGCFGWGHCTRDGTVLRRRTGVGVGRVGFCQVDKIIYAQVSLVGFY